MENTMKIFSAKRDQKVKTAQFERKLKAGLSRLAKEYFSFVNNTMAMK